MMKSTLGPEVPYISALKAAQHQTMEVKVPKSNVIYEDHVTSPSRSSKSISTLSEYGDSRRTLNSGGELYALHSFSLSLGFVPLGFPR